MRILNSFTVAIISLQLLLSCVQQKDQINDKIDYPENVINYVGNPKSADDRSFFSYSDQGAWFAYGFPDTSSNIIGFTGPFIMTQENGIWISPCLSNLVLENEEGKDLLNKESINVNQKSYLSHLEQSFVNEDIEIKQQLVFYSDEKAIIKTEIRNVSKDQISFSPIVYGNFFKSGFHINNDGQVLNIKSEKSNSNGRITLLNEESFIISNSDSTYSIKLDYIYLKPHESKEILLMQSFSFHENSNEHLENIDFDLLLNKRIQEKTKQLNSLTEKLEPEFQIDDYQNLLVKCVQTLQNNWRVPAEGLNYAGCFPSYHYVWFHGFWAWDSWKHAVALTYFNPELAKDQIRAMYDFQTLNGFIPDCVYRDTTIEANNYRNTKPPLSAWAVWNIFEQTNDESFLEEMYPKLVKYHDWWYTNRDHDMDSLCEYGSTDGTLIAAKWESGMDNAVRFDKSKILTNNTNAYSLDQESVDLNAYLYAEKLYLSKIAQILRLEADNKSFSTDANHLKIRIQQQFWNDELGWFFDTDITGEKYIEAMGPEGWIPLWANIATSEQAEKAMLIMTDSSKFFTKVPFPTVSADHPKFKPDGGYWRGPVWLDQAYFAVIALKNYGYIKEADQATQMLIENAEGLLDKGPAIRENYQPLTGKGLESYNFSWSAAHYLLLLLDE
ncbi:MAG: hypothetical protein KAR57_03315 [Bacteroidales bacterium]|nr:hypothetical protein [Bacteroidales bacterium]